MWSRLFYTFLSAVFTFYVCPAMYVYLPEYGLGSIFMGCTGGIVFILFFINWIDAFLIWKDIY